MHQTGRLKFFNDHSSLAGLVTFKAMLAPLRKIEWVVYAKEPFAGPKSVLAYLSRYTHRCLAMVCLQTMRGGVAISNSRLIRADANSVTFRVKDYRVDGPSRHKTMTLATSEFIRRFLIHVLPRGQHRIRHYGFFGNGNRAANIARIRGLLAVAPSPQSSKKTTEVDDDQSRVLALPCPACAGRMIIAESFAPECQPRAPPGRKAAA